MLNLELGVRAGEEDRRAHERKTAPLRAAPTLAVIMLGPPLSDPPNLGVATDQAWIMTEDRRPRTLMG